MIAQRAASVAVVALAAGLSPILVAPAHEDGKVELYVAALSVTPQGDGHFVDALVVDRDSGTAAAGFEVTFTATAGDRSVGPQLLASQPDGHYTGSATLERGAWRVAIAAAQGASAVPAQASTRSFDVDVASDGSATVDGDDEGGTQWWLVVLVACGVAVVFIGGAILLWRRRRA